MHVSRVVLGTRPSSTSVDVTPPTGTAEQQADGDCTFSYCPRGSSSFCRWRMFIHGNFVPFEPSLHVRSHTLGTAHNKNTESSTLVQWFPFLTFLGKGSPTAPLHDLKQPFIIIISYVQTVCYLIFNHINVDIIVDWKPFIHILYLQWSISTIILF